MNDKDKHQQLEEQITKLEAEITHLKQTNQANNNAWHQTVTKIIFYGVQLLPALLTLLT